MEIILDHVGQHEIDLQLQKVEKFVLSIFNAFSVLRNIV